MRVFKNTWFTRFADKEGIADGELKEMVNYLEAGQAEADLGGGVYKVRVARSGEGKSRGYRVIVFFKSEERLFYVYGFSKSDRSNIDQKETREYKALAKKYLNLSDELIEKAIQSGKFVEI
ncbi:hypothetical protein R84B8_01323 [Treponema sp. R8-4-B8]